MSDPLAEHFPDCAEKSDGMRGHFCRQCSDEISDYVGWPCPDLRAEIVPKNWYGLMAILDDLYPETIFPTQPDDARRDLGPRVISLVREVERLQDLVDTQRREAQSEVAHLRAEVDRLRAAEQRVRDAVAADERVYSVEKAAILAAFGGQL
jgi:hypothetical protein